MSIEWKEYGYHLGYRCYLVTLRNTLGYSASFTNFGAAMQSLLVPDKEGKTADVVLGYDTLEEYVKGDSCFGASIGRFANRIGGATFSLNGQEYKLFDNNGGNTLHGGEYGYHKRVWTVEELRDGEEPFVIFKYVSPSGEEHFPGTLTLSVKYTLLPNGVKIEYNATSTDDTVINFTNHSYFNLKGDGSGTILDHVVWLNSKQYTPVDAGLIPTGELADVSGTPFDFTEPKSVRTDMDNGKLPNGYDHNFILGDNRETRTAAVVREPDTGRVMTVTTDMPAMQMYVSIGLNNEKGKGGSVYPKFGGLCLETQFSPDTPNKPQFPSCVLKAGEEFSSATSYTFSMED
ncbi:MAG: galactose mutarotase [Oscillospiraceae bacterium]|nr:galactose mutarotase [Oscillospiraceae bacterium]